MSHDRDLADQDVEEVAEASSGPLWFQLYVMKDREVTRALVERAQQAGYKALCLTVDLPVLGQRERDLRNGATIPPKITVRNVVDVLRRPGWLRGVWFGPAITFQNFVGSSAAQIGVNGEGAAWVFRGGPSGLGPAGSLSRRRPGRPVSGRIRSRRRLRER